MTERKTCANENLGRRRRWEPCQNTCHGTEAKTGNRLPTQNDGATDGLPREETCAGLGIRRRICWLPGPVLHDRPVAEPRNLGSGWLGFDFALAFGLPVRVVNDAAMQALGSYRGGKMWFLGLGTGLGSAMIVNGTVEPMELGHLPYKKGTFEDYVGNLGLDRFGKKRWRKLVKDVVERLVAALEPQDVVIGGGNVIHMNKLPRGCRASNNAHAFIGAFRMWDDPPQTIHRPRKKKGPFVSRKRRTRT